MVTRFRRVLCFGIAGGLAIAAAPARAQVHDEQLWLQVNINVPLAERLRVTLEEIARVGDRAGGLYQTELGALLGYKVAGNVELGFGYRRVGAHGGNHAADEGRLRQQVVASFGRFSTRLRLDERFLDTGGAVGFRVRPLIRYTYPLGRPGVALFASHESFILPNSTSWGQRAGYERMRNIVGVAVPVGRRISADVGYLNQYRFARGRARSEMDHALTLQLTINLAERHHPRVDD